MKVKSFGLIAGLAMCALLATVPSEARVQQYFDGQGNLYLEYEYSDSSNAVLRYSRFDTTTGDKTSETRYVYNSEGKRTQINTFTYSKDSSGNLQEIRQNEQEYDPATGSRTRLTYFDSNTNTKSYEYLYRPDNQQLSYTRFDTATGEKTSETRYVYNSDGKRTELNQYVYEKDASGNLEERLQSATEYYPDTGNQKRRVQYNTSTNQKTYEYTYDSSGRMTGYMRFDSAGSMIYKDERIYGDDGKIKEIKEYGLNESGEFVVDKISSYEYYPNGNSKKTVQVKMIGDEAKTISEINYYENGRTQSQAYYDQSTGAKTYDYTYDENGRQSSYQRYASDGTTVTNRYEYTYN
ncbi:MAG: hypothetical protein KC649_06165 [Candidatus Omnitrophica bacterium]|nr:hypothetical protein [Candidatus Omnitrophota bacterium]